jgi:hypothetical protein
MGHFNSAIDTVLLPLAEPHYELPFALGNLHVGKLQNAKFRYPDAGVGEHFKNRYVPFIPFFIKTSTQTEKILF